MRNRSFVLVAALALSGVALSAHHSSSLLAPVAAPYAVTVTLPTGEVTVQGTVVHSIRGVGFAVQFAEVDEETHARLSVL